MTAELLDLSCRLSRALLPPARDADIEVRADGFVAGATRDPRDLIRPHALGGRERRTDWFQAAPRNCLIRRPTDFGHLDRLRRLCRWVTIPADVTS